MRRNIVKAVFITCLIALPFSLSALDLIGLRVGPIAMINHAFDPENADSSFFRNLELDDLSFGVDARFNLTVFEVNTIALVEPKTNDAGAVYGASVTANIGAGISIPFMDIVKIGLFVGPALSFAVTVDGIEQGDDFPMSGEELFASNLFLRLAADVMLGTISIGGTYIVDTGTNLNRVFDGTYQLSDLFGNLQGRIGAAVLFELF